MKILIIRLSSIGDVLLTTPILRCIKSQLGDVEIHYLTKPHIASLLEPNPYIDKLKVLSPTLSNTIDELKKEHYDYVVDLHNNHRSRRIRMSLRVPSSVYRKDNLDKFCMVLFKTKCLSHRHVVDRYFGAVKRLGVTDDDKGLDCFLPKNIDVASFQPSSQLYTVIACGAQHYTKQIPVERLEKLCSNIEAPVLLLGDKNDFNRIESSGMEMGSNVYNLCGKTSIVELAALVRDAAVVVTPDTAIMHIAAAFERPVVAIWGATDPLFGFSAFRCKHVDFVAEGLRCHPCSRMGGKKCPRKHFKCMQQQDWNKIYTTVNELLKA